jgi:hypothetical protein
MKRAVTSGKWFGSKTTDDCTRFDGKTVEFLFDREGKLQLLTGEFVVHATRGAQYVEVHYTGRLDPNDSPFSDYLFRLSPAHLRSAFATTRPGSQVDFLMEKPLLFTTCVKLESWEQRAVESVQ